MNRTRIAFSVFAFVVVMAFAAVASATPSVGTLEITGGYAKSSTEMAAPFTTDSPGGGLSVGAGYFRGIAPKTSWGVEMAYDNLGSVDWTDGTDNYTSSVSVIRVTPEFRMNFGAPVGPSFFAQAGGGYYSVKAKVEDTTVSTEASASNGKFGFNLGAGVGFPVGPKTKLNFQGNYHSVQTEGQSTNYLGLRAGLSLNL